jgi:hypothetical protein
MGATKREFAKANGPINMGKQTGFGRKRARRDAGGMDSTGLLFQQWWRAVWVRANFLVRKYVALVSPQ